MAYKKVRARLGQYSSWHILQLKSEIRNRSLPMDDSAAFLRKTLENDDAHDGIHINNNNPSTINNFVGSIATADARETEIQALLTKAGNLFAQWSCPEITETVITKARNKYNTNAIRAAKAQKQTEIDEIKQDMEELRNQMKSLGLRCNALEAEIAGIGMKFSVARAAEVDPLRQRLDREHEVDDALKLKLIELNRLISNERPICKDDLAFLVPNSSTSILETVRPENASASKKRPADEPALLFHPKKLSKQPSKTSASASQSNKPYQNSSQPAPNRLSSPLHSKVSDPKSRDDERYAHSSPSNPPSVSHAGYNASPLASMTSAVKPARESEASTATLPKKRYGKLQWAGGRPQAVNFSSGRSWAPATRPSTGQTQKSRQKSDKQQIRKFETENPNHPRLSEEVFIRFNHKPVTVNNKAVTLPVTAEELAKIKEITDNYETKYVKLLEGKVFIVFVTEGADHEHTTEAVACWNKLNNAMGKWAYSTVFTKAYIELFGNDYTI